MTSAAVTRPSNPEPRRMGVVYPEVKLTSQQARQWSETLAAVNWIAPGYTHLLYTMMVRDNGIDVALFTEALQATAATDGDHLLFKPSEFFQLTLMERVFAVTHEISHCVADHCGMGYQMKKRGKIVMGNKSLPYDPQHSNIVQDLIINDMLIESNFGTFNKAWLHDPKVATFKDDWVEVYFKTYKKDKQKGKGNPDTPCDGGQGGQTPPGAGQFDQHLDPGTTNGKAPEDVGPRDVQAWQQAVAGALAVAQAQGKCPSAFELHFGSMLEPKVDWTEHLKALVSRRVGSGGYDFRRPDRRLIIRDIIAPGRTGFGAGLVVIAYDTSGSIFSDPTLIDRFKAETIGIFSDVKPKEIILLECDADIQRVTEMTDASDMAEINVLRGGGGTDFRPVFDYIEEHDLKPDCLLYLTDLFGSFPDEEPKYSVIWGSISGKEVGVPFGDLVYVPTE